MTEPTLPSSTRPIPPGIAAVLQSLRPGQRIRVRQTVRLNSRPGKSWTTTVEGTFREWNFLRTGLGTDRVPEDDIVVVAVHFTKEPHGELSSVTLDPATEISVVPVVVREP
jgi:hypothetical protein